MFKDLRGYLVSLVPNGTPLRQCIPFLNASTLLCFCCGVPALTTVGGGGKRVCKDRAPQQGGRFVLSVRARSVVHVGRFVAFPFPYGLGGHSIYPFPSGLVSLS